MENLEKRIATLEKEQLLIKRHLQENLELDRQLIKIVKDLCSNIEKLETIDTNGTE